MLVPCHVPAPWLSQLPSTDCANHTNGFGVSCSSASYWSSHRVWTQLGSPAQPQPTRHPSAMRTLHPKFICAATYEHSSRPLPQATVGRPPVAPITANACAYTVRPSDQVLYILSATISPSPDHAHAAVKHATAHGRLGARTWPVLNAGSNLSEQAPELRASRSRRPCTQSQPPLVPSKPQPASSPPQPLLQPGTAASPPRLPQELP